MLCLESVLTKPIHRVARAHYVDGYTVYSGYSGHNQSGHTDIVATFPVTKYIYSIIFRSDIVARKGWPKVATISEVHCIYVTYMSA